ncbi:hypothetical protein [Psychroserpens sp. MEBiC05023]
MDTIDIILKWMGILTLLYLLGKFLAYVFGPLGIYPDTTWKEVFQKMNK